MPFLKGIVSNEFHPLRVQQPGGSKVHPVHSNFCFTLSYFYV